MKGFSITAVDSSRIMITNYALRRLVTSNTGSVPILSVVLVFAFILLGTFNFQYSNYRQFQDSNDIAVSMVSNAAYAASPPEYVDRIKVNAVQNKPYISYADWLYITDRETQSYRPPGDDTLRFWGPDTLDGPVHSNDKLHFQFGAGYWPVFWGTVTSCSTSFSPMNAPDYVEFNGGYELDFHYFPLPTQADSVRAHNYYGDPNLGVSPAAQNDSVTEITFTPEYFLLRHRSQLGTEGGRQRNYYPAGEGGVWREGTIDQAPQYQYPPTGAIFIEGELWLAGAKGNHYNSQPGSGEPETFIAGGFAGEMTIAASGDIIIAQDVVYASCDPDYSVPFDSPDVLGIISEKHLLIWRNAPVTMRIHAGLGAIGMVEQEYQHSPSNCPNGTYPPNGINGTISVDGINCYGISNAKLKLTICGCLIMKERGLIHSSYQGGERGYDSKDYIYDWRFRRNPPPHFFITRGRDSYYAQPYNE
ncbi:MAG: hypothetical protein GY839_07310 [candidate division Zixibacteria bacterium]|nr:hypothetical protein [candidate division Zixibacteria bacterium]